MRGDSHPPFSLRTKVAKLAKEFRWPSTVFAGFVHFVLGVKGHVALTAA